MSWYYHHPSPLLNCYYCCRYLEGIELDELAHGAVHRHRGGGLEQVGADLRGAYRIVERLSGGGGDG